MMTPNPDYKKIYTDLLIKKHPNKLSSCSLLLQKEVLTILDILRLNKIIWGDEGQFDQKHKAYKKSTILEILEYQRKNGLNNTETANYFKLSRNTVAKWKKYFSCSI